MGVNSSPFTASRAGWADKVWPRIVGRFRRAVLTQKRRPPSMLPQRRLPQPIRGLLWFVSIGAVVGAVYGHTIAVLDGAPLLGFGGLPRGVLTGVVTTGALFFFEQVWARPAMAPLRRLPFLPHLAIKTVIYLLIVLVGLAIGAGLFPAPAEAGAG
jgi:hypothetical protein